MSSMLEQAIVDAAALREAALKNAEQAIIDKYAPQIKEAVESLLDKEVINEQEVATSDPEPSSLEAPFAASPSTNLDQEVTLTLSDDDQVYEFDLDKIKMAMKKEGPAAEEDGTTTPELASDLGLGELGGETDAPEPDAGGDDLGIGDDLLQEFVDFVSSIDGEEQVLEEELVVDMAGDHKNGTFETSTETLKYQKEMELARQESDELKEENEELEKRLEEISESYQSLQNKNKNLNKIINKLDNSLKETLLSNAKLLYCNKTLSDASLNERQKTKIVEAIAKAQTPEEAKNLHEALKTTVGSSKKEGPKSLRESVNRRSNLSGIMPRKQKPEQEFSFADQMKKLAGIK